MQREITDEALELLLARAGLELSDEQKAELKSVYAGIAEMAERVRKPQFSRGSRSRRRCPRD